MWVMSLKKTHTEADRQIETDGQDETDRMPRLPYKNKIAMTMLSAINKIMIMTTITH